VIVGLIVGMRIARGEIFGPAVSALPFDDLGKPSERVATSDRSQ
jgi:acyl-CoA reductase-like NAD-dependent aldehyde dehydrogenase